MAAGSASLAALLREVRNCRACEPHLPHGARPVLQAGTLARILVVGQAPSARVHASGVPWDDRSGERLRGWMDVDAATFYDASRIALVPMAFCYPGRGNGGDLPPRRECAERWHARVLERLPHIALTLLVGLHAQRHFLDTRGTLTATTRAWREHVPRVLPLPHPSPRNTAWFQSNRWFDAELLPALRARVAAALQERR
jgi:uracil-DNA glycosylase